MIQSSIKRFTTRVNTQKLLEEYIKKTPIPDSFRDEEETVDLDLDEDENEDKSETGSESEESIQDSDEDEEEEFDEKEYATLEEVAKSQDTPKLKAFYSKLKFSIMKNKMVFGRKKFVRSLNETEFPQIAKTYLADTTKTKSKGMSEATKKAIEEKDFNVKTIGEDAKGTLGQYFNFIRYAERVDPKSLKSQQIVSWTRMEKFLDFYSSTHKKTNSIRNKAKHLLLFVKYIHCHDHLDVCVTLERLLHDVSNILTKKRRVEKFEKEDAVFLTIRGKYLLHPQYKYLNRELFSGMIQLIYKYKDWKSGLFVGLKFTITDAYHFECCLATAIEIATIGQRPSFLRGIMISRLAKIGNCYQVKPLDEKTVRNSIGNTIPLSPRLTKAIDFYLIYIRPMLNVENRNCFFLQTNGKATTSSSFRSMITSTIKRIFPRVNVTPLTLRSISITYLRRSRKLMEEKLGLNAMQKLCGYLNTSQNMMDQYYDRNEYSEELMETQRVSEDILNPFEDGLEELLQDLNESVLSIQDEADSSSDNTLEDLENQWKKKKQKASSVFFTKSIQFYKYAPKQKIEENDYIHHLKKLYAVRKSIHIASENLKRLQNLNKLLSNGLKDVKDKALKSGTKEENIKALHDKYCPKVERSKKRKSDSSFDEEKEESIETEESELEDSLFDEKKERASIQKKERTSIEKKQGISIEKKQLIGIETNFGRNSQKNERGTAPRNERRTHDLGKKELDRLR